MAKIRERKLCERLYVHDRKTAKECAKILNVTENTVGKWVDKYNWKDKRSALVSTVENGVANLNKLINIYTERLIEIEGKDYPKPIDEDSRKLHVVEQRADAQERIKLTDAIAKLNKTKDNFEKEHRIPYSTYIKVSEQIMSHMIEKMDGTHHEALLDFFEEHTNDIALNFK